MNHSVQPSEPDVTQPSVARMYDYYLGGTHNYSVDREAAHAVTDVYPNIPALARANRAFLRRAVSYLLDCGIDQFLDLGAGIPTVGSVHEIAQSANPAARVVYVDRDTVAVNEARALLADNPLATTIQADIRKGAEVLADAELRALLDLSRPLAVLMFAVLHFVPDSDDPLGVIAPYRAAMSPGSYLVVSHVSPQDDQVSSGDATQPAEARTDGAQQAYRNAGSELVTRTAPEVSALFDGFDLVGPAVAELTAWRPSVAETTAAIGLDPLPPGLGGVGGIGRKP